MGRSIFFIGATGYIGSTVLDRLLKADPDAKVTVYGRRPEALEGFAKVNSRLVPAEGSLSDHDKLEKLASEHDVTVNCADADGVEATAAILRGLKKRHESGKTPILLHTSGTGTLSDLDAGTFATKDIYTDLEKSDEFKTLSSLPDNAFHREVDLSIIQADKEGYVKAYIILPSTIYGISETPFADAGLCNPQSQQVPLLIRISLDRKAPAMIGEGKNLWPDVHIDDCADLFAVVYEGALRGDIGHGADGNYFAENGEHSMLDVAEAIGKALSKRGLGQAEPKTLSKEEVDKYTGGSTYLGSNSRARAQHSREIGWKPKYGEKDFLESIGPDIDWTLKHNRGKKDGHFVWGKGPQIVNGQWTLPS